MLKVFLQTSSTRIDHMLERNRYIGFFIKAENGKHSSLQLVQEMVVKLKKTNRKDFDEKFVLYEITFQINKNNALVNGMADCL
jgi:hypothetical protein